MQVNRWLQKASGLPRVIRSNSGSEVATERRWLVFESWLWLLYIEYIMKFRDSKALRRIVGNQRVRPTRPYDLGSREALCHAMDVACVFYLKRVLCLQRAAATTALLRRYGWEAEMVIGAQIVPYEFHAWVEIAGKVVNDMPYMHEIYQVLERY
jgi:hypothetical protein